MANEVIKMVTKSIKSFVKKDIEMARNVIVYDDVVDNYFEEIKKELIRIISSEKVMVKNLLYSYDCQIS